MRRPIPAEPPARPEPPVSYFELQASWGLTKHFGGAAATEALLAHRRRPERPCCAGPGSPSSPRSATA